MSDETRICKDCNQPFVLTQAQLQRFSQQKAGLRRMVPPVRCPSCIVIHRKMVQHLACVTIPIGKAISGEGCYLPLTLADLAEIASWHTSSAKWEQYATDDIPDRPTAVQFNVDQKVAGALSFTDHGEQEGLIVDTWAFAPWIGDYPDAARALAYYMITESMRCGYRGAFRMKAELHQRETLWSLGMEEIPPGSGMFSMSEDAALGFIFRDEGLRTSIVSRLQERSQAGEANLPWILLKMMQKKLTSLMVNEMTKAHSEPNWRVVRQGVEYESSMLTDVKDSLLNKLQGILGQLAAVEILQQVDPRLQYETEQVVNGQYIDVLSVTSKKATIQPCIDVASLQSGTTTALHLKKGDFVAVEVKAWKYGSYLYPSALFNLKREVRKIRETFSHVLVMVTGDFHRLPDHQKLEFAQAVRDAGGLVYVMRSVSAEELKRRANLLLKQLR